MILPISNCFQLETEGSFPHANLHQTQKENLHVKRPKDLPSLPHQIPTLTPKPTPISTRPPSIQLSSPDQPHETATKGRTKDAKLLEQKNEGGSRLEWEGRKQEDRLSAQLLSKVHLVRQIELQISLLQSKSKQPGTKTHNLQSLGYQIYDKIDNYYIHYGIYHNKSKLSTHFQTSLLNKTGYEAAGGEVRGRKTTHRNSVAFSEAQDLEQEQGVEIRKVLKTTENLDISVSSATETQKVDDQMHIFETKLTESQLAGLDKPLRSSFEGEGQGELAKESQFQLKESIRVMQERIVFLIHRLEQTKSEVSDLKEENVELQTKLRKQTDWGRELKGEHQFLCLLHQKNLEETERLQKMVESAKNKHREFAEIIIRHEKEISEQKEEIESCHSELAEKQSKIGKIQAALWLKNQEYAQLASAYRGFEEEKETRKTELVAKLQESEDEKARLRQTIKQYKFRLQTQGLSFKFEQAHRLKQLFEESSAIHQREIQKIEGQYSKTIQNLKQTLQQSISSRKQLQSALVQSLGLKRYSALDQPEYTFSEKGFRQATASSHLTDFTCEQLSKEFVNFVQRYKIAETELQNQKQKIEKYEDRIQILKEECQERFMANKELSSNLAGKSEQIQELNKEIEQLKRYLRQNLASFGKSKKSSQPPSVRTSKIQSKIIQINFAKQTPSDLSELTLQSFIKKRVLSTPKNILKFILKLISFSQQLQCSHRRKLPSLAPHSILLSVKKLQDLDISFSIISKKEQEQGLIYQAPQILLGFSQSSQSHCWTIGVILDQMLTNRKFFKSFSDILSHKDNYTILDDSFKNLEVLHQMIRKSHKQRITLDQAKRKLQLVCNAYP